MSKVVTSIALVFASLHLSIPAASAVTESGVPIHMAPRSAPASKPTTARSVRATRVTTIRAASIVPGPWRKFAVCVLDRESGGTLSRQSSGSGARNPSSSAQGRWQFLDRLWRDSLATQVAARLREHGMPRAEAALLRGWLQDRDIASWPGALQDVGFIEVIERGGWRHWALHGSLCGHFLPAGG